VIIYHRYNLIYIIGRNAVVRLLRGLRNFFSVDSDYFTLCLVYFYTEHRNADPQKLNYAAMYTTTMTNNVTYIMDFQCDDFNTVIISFGVHVNMQKSKQDKNVYATVNPFFKNLLKLDASFHKANSPSFFSFLTIPAMHSYLSVAVALFVVTANAASNAILSNVCTISNVQAALLANGTSLGIEFLPSAVLLLFTMLQHLAWVVPQDHQRPIHTVTSQ
jgi:hypothetical protein